MDDNQTYAVWREKKLAHHARTIDQLIVQVTDPRRLTDAEHAAVLHCCQQNNMAIYASKTGDDPDKDIPKRLGEQFGLYQRDHNPGADEDAVTSICVQSDALHRGYIPYTNRAIAWHTDGYYNAPHRQVRAFILHCVQPANKGGENGLIDPENIYIRLRDRDPSLIRALMRQDAMSIPANVSDGRTLRPISIGPVLTWDANGKLHMRYTDRRRNVIWHNDPDTSAAVAALRETFDAVDTLPVLRSRLEPGWGVICNNVLHARERFDDDGSPRLLYRARYYNRIAGT